MRRPKHGEAILRYSHVLRLVYWTDNDADVEEASNMMASRLNEVKEVCYAAGAAHPSPSSSLETPSGYSPTLDTTCSPSLATVCLALSLVLLRVCVLVSMCVPVSPVSLSDSLFLRASISRFPPRSAALAGLPHQSGRRLCAFARASLPAVLFEA